MQLALICPAEDDQSDGGLFRASQSEGPQGACLRL